MFDIGWSELLVVGVVALVVIGPKELPGVLRTVGQMVGKVRRMAGEFQGQFQEALREAELADLKKGFTDFTEEANKSISGALPSNPLLDLENEVKAATAAIEGRKDEPATKIEDDVAVAEGLDPTTAEMHDAQAAAVEAQLPKPHTLPPPEPHAFEEMTGGSAAPEPLPAAATAHVETRPLETKTAEGGAPEAAPAKRKPRVASQSTSAEPSATTPAKPKRKPRVVAETVEPEVSEAVAALDDTAATEKPKRKPKAGSKTPSAGDEGPGAA